MIFGAIDLASGWAEVIKLKHKTEVPECIMSVLRYCASVGVTVRRFHTDNENVFHSPDAAAAATSKLAPQGVLVTCGCEYAHRQK